MEFFENELLEMDQDPLYIPVKEEKPQHLKKQYHANAQDILPLVKVEPVDPLSLFPQEISIDPLAVKVEPVKPLPVHPQEILLDPLAVLFEPPTFEPMDPLSLPPQDIPIDPLALKVESVKPFPLHPQEILLDPLAILFETMDPLSLPPHEIPVDPLAEDPLALALPVKTEEKDPLLLPLAIKAEITDSLVLLHKLKKELKTESSKSSPGIAVEDTLQFDEDDLQQLDDMLPISKEIDDLCRLNQQIDLCEQSSSNYTSEMNENDDSDKDQPDGLDELNKPDDLDKGYEPGYSDEENETVNTDDEDEAVNSVHGNEHVDSDVEDYCHDLDLPDAQLPLPPSTRLHNSFSNQLDYQNAQYQQCDSYMTSNHTVAPYSSPQFPGTPVEPALNPYVRLLRLPELELRVAKQQASGETKKQQHVLESAINQRQPVIGVPVQLSLNPVVHITRMPELEKRIRAIGQLKSSSVMTSTVSSTKKASVKKISTNSLSQTSVIHEPHRKENGIQRPKKRVKTSYNRRWRTNNSSSVPA